MKRNRKLLIGAAVVLAATGGGVAIAASDSSPSEENQAVIDDAAKQLGIPSSKLSDALKSALADRIDAAVAAGRITKAEGDALKQRIDSGDYGWCEETGDPIGIARLLARPTATLTIEAQQRRETRERMFGG